MRGWRGIPGAAVRLAALALIVLSPASADWLVTRDGYRVETAGPWRVQDSLVIFELPDGTLSSLKLAEVDLEASARATEESRRAVEEQPPEAVEERPVQPVLVLTDADVRHVDRDPEPPTDDESAEQAAAPQEEPASASRLEVTSWQEAEEPGIDGVAIVGRAANTSSQLLVQARVTVRLLGPEGEVIEATDARLTATRLPPGTSANFRADFPSVFGYQSVEFETDAFAVETEGEEESPPGVPALARESG